MWRDEGYIGPPNGKEYIVGEADMTGEIENDWWAQTRG